MGTMVIGSNEAFNARHRMFGPELAFNWFVGFHIPSLTLRRCEAGFKS
jgi:hypothetical protein